MKIKKFNESVNNNWTDDKLRKFVKDHENLNSILRRYLKIKVTDVTLKNHDDDPDYELYHFFFDKKGQFVIKYIDVGDFTGYDHYRPDNDNVIIFINSWSKLKKWTIDTLFDHCEEHMYLINAFEEYLRWKIEDYDDDNSCRDINFFFFNNKFKINFIDDDSDYNTYEVDDYDEMIEFLKNFDIFMNSKKYNL